MLKPGGNANRVLDMQAVRPSEPLAATRGLRPSQVPRPQPRSCGPASVQSPSQIRLPVGLSVPVSGLGAWRRGNRAPLPLGGLALRAPCGPRLPALPESPSSGEPLARPYRPLPGLRRVGSCSRRGPRGGRRWGFRGFPGAGLPRTDGSPAPPAGGSRVRGAKRRSINFSAQKSMLLSGRRSMPAQPGGTPPGLGPGAGRPGSGAVAGAGVQLRGGCRARPPPRGAHTSARGPLAPPCGLS